MLTMSIGKQLQTDAAMNENKFPDRALIDGTVLKKTDAISPSRGVANLKTSRLGQAVLLNRA